MDPQNAAPPIETPSKKSRFWIIAIVALGGVAGVALLCCGAVAFLILFSEAQRMSAEILRNEIRGNAEVERHLGEILSIDMNIAETQRLQKERGREDNWLAMDAQGIKGSGTFILQSLKNNPKGTVILGIELQLPDGTIIKVK